MRRIRKWTVRDKWVYALVDPRDNLVHYVGCSYHPEYRLKQHCDSIVNCAKLPTYQWLAGLLAANMKPILVILEKGHDEVEKKWITQFAAAGHPLHNIRNNAQKVA